MLNYLKNQSNKTYTENGAVTNESTMSHCLDLFATIGALRRANDGEIINRFIRAFSEDKDTAMKILFFGRDVRGGLGERRVFRVIINWLAVNEPSALRKNIALIPEYGRYDDLVSLLGTECEKDAIRVIKEQLKKDMSAENDVSLLAKWLPSVNTSNKDAVKNAKKIAMALSMTDAEYRKTLVKLRSRIRIIENNLRIKDYTFDYSKQPSKAMLKYSMAFYRNDGKRYSEFLSKVKSGEVSLHADTVMPYELVAPYITDNWTEYNKSFMKPISEEEKAVLNATWSSLPDFGNGENAIAVIDTSGSMYWEAKPTPASVALSLGLYFAEHNKGAFKNHFIEFSSRPQLIEIEGETFADKLRFVTSFCEVADTNLESVFKLILDAAVAGNVPQNELPQKIYIISDMEFNACVSNADLSNFANARKLFASHGYKLPQIVFWNVSSRNRQMPVTMNEEGVALVSGCTPRLFSMIASGELSPLKIMIEVLEAERYAKISA